MTLSTPVKIVALAALAIVLGLGGFVLLVGKHSSSPSQAVTPPPAKAHFTVKVAPKPKPVVHLLPGLPSVLRSALLKRQVAVVAIFSSHNASDRSLLAQARAGAHQAHAAFVAANVALEGVALGLATWSHNPAAPAVVVVRRPGKVVFAVSGPTDSATVAQAALTSR
ncbi:MAG TPA: hypothetical protein VFW85_02320 [Gaiellaceae bacterium]|nr:hypothetical protein [Gaiellaceae bacterium]